jgi:hypothetical protein
MCAKTSPSTAVLPSVPVRPQKDGAVPSWLRTDGKLPSRPVLSDVGRTGRLTTLYTNLTMSSNPNPSSSSSSTYNELVSKHSGANFATWKTKMEMLLIRADLWSYVSRRKLRPTPSGSASSSRTRSNTPGRSSDDNDAAVQKWDEDAKRATAEIFLDLDKHFECGVLNIRNPVELWGKLQTFFERKGFSSHFYL